MHILHLMFSKNLGGLEQAFLDYNDALKKLGHHVTNVIQPKSKIAPLMAARSDQLFFLRNHGQWDIWAIIKLRKLINKLKPDVIITHGNRPYILLKRAFIKTIPCIAVVHGYNLKHTLGATALFTVSKQLMNLAIAQGHPPDRIFHIPNMIHNIEVPKVRNRFSPPVIGAMGRFVKVKGMDLFLHALALLKQKNIAFCAILAGNGQEDQNLKKLISDLSLQNEVRCPGWIEHKTNFYEAIDIFCLPSHHEQFGIVLLEAFSHQKPVVSTISEGPKEIAEHEKHALLVPIHNPVALANALERVLNNPLLAERLAIQGRQLVEAKYSLEIVSKELEKALKQIMKT